MTSGICGIEFQPSLRDSIPWDSGPSVKTLGYFRLSLRDKNLFGMLVLLALLSLPVHSQDEPPKKTLFLPKSPVAAAYVLSRLSNKELIEAPRSEFVYVALLQRKELERKYRVEALEGLAKIRNSDTLTELIKGIRELDAKGEESEPVLRDLASILLQNKPSDLS